MKQCLNCQKEFEFKRTAAKFCSTKCRVMYNRKNPSQGVTKHQLQTLYNTFLEAIGNLKYSSPKESNEQPRPPAALKGSPKLTIKRSFLNFQTLIEECQSMEEYEPLRKEIEESDYLSKREKDILLRKR